MTTRSRYAFARRPAPASETGVASRRAPTGLDAFYQEFYNNPLFAEFYKNSGYANFGYWTSRTQSAADAGDQLVEQILRYIPKHQRYAGDILDVACGQGASTKRLAQQFPAHHITAIGIDPEQVAAAQRRVPDVSVKQMDATRLEFPDDSFDTVLCVEAAFHFRTREQFLREALRVLKPGGHLVMSDLLMARTALLVPRENYLPDIASYQQLLRVNRFQNVAVRDETRRTWQAYRQALNHFISSRLLTTFSPRDVAQLLTLNVTSTFSIRRCVILGAQKAESRKARAQRSSG